MKTGLVGHSSQRLLVIVRFTAEGPSVRIFSAWTATREERKDCEETAEG